MPRVLLAAAALAALGALAALVLAAEPADATHFRSGTLYAVPEGGTTVSIQGRIAFRASYPGAATTPPGPPSFPCQPGNYATATGAIGAASNFAIVPIVVTDSAGGPSGVPNVSGKLEVLACNGVDDWFLGRLVDSITGQPGVRVTLPAPLDPTGNPWLVTWDSAARVSYTDPYWHVNNPDRGWALQASINLANQNHPPRPFVMPIIQCALTGLCSIPIPFLDEDGANNTHGLRFATGCEAGGGNCAFFQPGPCPGFSGSPGCGAALPATAVSTDPQNLLVTWDPAGATQTAGTFCHGTYSTQVMVEDLDPGSGAVVSKSPMDFLIHLCDPAGAPEWVPGPGEAQTACLLSPTIVAGGTITFSLYARSTAARTIQIIPLEWPAGATMGANSFGNPATTTFTWDTTGVAPGEYLAVFFAQDDVGLTATSTCIVKIHVLAPIPVDFRWHFTGTAPQDLTFDPVQFEDNTTLPPAYQVSMRFWRWDFGDPHDLTQGYGQEPQHTFHRGTNYGLPHNVCMELTLRFTGGPWTGRRCHDVVVHNRPPTPLPHAVMVYGDLVRFVDAGGDRDGTVIDWRWQWGEEGAGPSQGHPAMHRYGKSGIYTVCLATTDDQMLTGQACTTVEVHLIEPWMDTDLDGVVDGADNCPERPNAGQADADRDGIGDACRPAAFSLDLSQPLPAGFLAPPPGDRDRDGVLDRLDVCPHMADVEQRDLDLDGDGDLCDPDLDGDGVPQWGPPGSRLDLCPTTPDPGQEDADGDGAGDACDFPVAVPDRGRAGPPVDPSPVAAPAGIGGAVFGATPSQWGPALLGALAVLAGVGAATLAWTRRRWG